MPLSEKEIAQIQKDVAALQSAQSANKSRSRSRPSKKYVDYKFSAIETALIISALRTHTSTEFKDDLEGLCNKMLGENSDFFLIMYKRKKGRSR